MLRKFLAILSIISMANSSWAKDDLPQCKIQDHFALMGLNNSKIEDFFSKIICLNVGMNDDVNLDVKYCEKIHACQGSSQTKDLSTVDDKDFLLHESSELLLREALYKGKKKYDEEKSINMRLMFSYLDGLPDSDKKNINNRCDTSKVHNDICLENPEMNKLAKSYLDILHYKIMDASLKNPEKSKLLIQSSLDEIHKAPLDFANNKNGEEKIKESANLLKVNNDEILEKISAEIASEDISTMSDIKMKGIIKNVLLEFSKNKKDSALSYDGDKLNGRLDKFLSSLSFKSSNFSLDNDNAKNNLISNINKLRVNIANESTEKNCDNVYLNYGQICSKVNDDLKTGKIIKSLGLSHKNIFQKIIDHYRSSNDEDRENKIARLNRMKNDENKNYSGYLAFLIQSNACDAKFQNKQSVYNSSQFKESVKEKERLAKITREVSIQSVLNTVKANNYLQKEFGRMGITMPVDNLNSKESAAIAKSEQENSFAKESANPVSDNGLFVEPKAQTIQSDNFSSNTISSIDDNAVDENIKSKDDRESQLHAKQAELEAKEKSLSNKDSVIGGDEQNSSSQGPVAEEIKALRQEIDDLKKALAKSAEAKEGGTTGLKSNSGVIRSSNENSSFINRNSESFGRNNYADSSAMSVRNIPGPRDFSYENNGATRAPASIGPSGNSKTASENMKSAITLTKSGQLQQDPGNIPNDPKEEEISNILEATNGASFRIREKGQLMEVSVVIDNGKPVFELNGKYRYKRTRLSKNQQETANNEENMQRQLKEVVPTVRLNELKRMINKSVKRD